MAERVIHGVRSSTNLILGPASRRPSFLARIARLRWSDKHVDNVDFPASPARAEDRRPRRRAVDSRRGVCPAWSGRACPGSCPSNTPARFTAALHSSCATVPTTPSTSQRRSPGKRGVAARHGKLPRQFGALPARCFTAARILLVEPTGFFLPRAQDRLGSRGRGRIPTGLPTRTP